MPFLFAMLGTDYKSPASEAKIRHFREGGKPLRPAIQTMDTHLRGHDETMNVFARSVATKQSRQSETTPKSPEGDLTQGTVSPFRGLG